MSNKIILSIETSCDDTAISILSCKESKLNILTSKVSSQIKLHAKWGGVVPNLAAREHLKNFPKLIKLALDEAKVSIDQIDFIAVTSGPGLIPALLVGVNYAKTLSYLWEKPLIGIHHIEGHIYANFVDENSKFKIQNSTQIQRKKCKIMFPILALVVSGGHTQLVLMKNHLQYEIVGQTLDDAVGEAFDKVARILGIGYPGGPAVALRASQVKSQKSKAIQDTKYNIKFPRPMLHKKNFNFSFSGLKTAVLYETKKHPELLKNKEYIAEICHEFQQACVEVLIAKTLKAAEQFNPKTILLAGGVSANTELRKQLGEAIQKSIPNTSYKIPDTSLTGDNATMIGAAAAFRWEKMTAKQKKEALLGWKMLQANANLKMN
ncbi:MAG: tRNA (adenosine(37)-N6)-threonylcarbamoyltransferase complex transferase subunit TsaD [bacterium]